MKYMLLVHHNEESFRKRSEAERQHMLQESVQLAQQLYASGQYLGAAPLHQSSETTCVRVRDGKPLVTDGPFAETREQLGGYFLIAAKRSGRGDRHRRPDSRCPYRHRRNTAGNGGCWPAGRVVQEGLTQPRGAPVCCVSPPGHVCLLERPGSGANWEDMADTGRKKKSYQKQGRHNDAIHGAGQS